MTRFQPQQFGKYFLLEKLAVGGMAEIYKAKTYGAEGFEKLLAIKRILPHAAEDKEFINMLIDEAKLSVLLSHANIVQVFDLGKIGSDYFISMEYIHGVNVRDVLYKLREKGEKIAAELAVFIASETCKGLDYAHRKTDSEGNALDIVHRDISPQNILISYEGEVKIVDFGIAKAAMNISNTMAGILKGKISYMSPEQAMGKAIDNRTDIFSLGILLYEALTGKKLFTGESQFEVLKKIRTTRIHTEQLPENLPAELKNILAKALAYDPKDRYQQASDMSVALTRFLYSTYTDFSPRKLATFIRKHFPPEEKDHLGETAKHTIIGEQTGSTKGQPPSQKNIVHRPTKTNVSANLTVSETMTRPKPNVSRSLALFGVFSFLVAGSVGYFHWKSQKAQTIAVTTNTGGTLQVNSQPKEATIFLNGEKTGFKTPAILENLTLRKAYTIGLELEEHGRKEEAVTLNNIDPVILNFQLFKQFGILSIISEPEGAAILVNDIAIGKSTPAKIEDLLINKEYRIVISKPGFEDFEQTITLVSYQPQKMLTTLKPIVEKKEEVIAAQQETTPAATPIEEKKSEEPKEIEKPAMKPAEQITPTPAPIPQKPILTPQPEAKPAESVKTKPKPQAKPKPIPAPLTKPKEIPPPPKQLPQAPPQTEAIGTGQLQITSEPSGADVFINNDHQGATPLTLTLPSGSVKVLISKGADLLPCSRNVTIKPNQQASFGCNLGSLYGEVILNSNPTHADVYLNGKKLGKTPLTIKKVKRSQSHTLKIERSGYQPWSTTLEMENSAKKSFNVELEKE